MTKIEFIRGEMMAAMKARDKKRKDVLSMLLTALKNKAIDKREDLTTEEEDQIILKQIKQTKETLEMTPADRTDIIEECEYTIKVLEEYAPKMMSEDEIQTVIKEVLSELAIETPTAKDKGKIMKELMPRVKGKADGKVVNQVLASMMQQDKEPIVSSVKSQEQRVCIYSAAGQKGTECRKDGENFPDNKKE